MCEWVSDQGKGFRHWQQQGEHSGPITTGGFTCVWVWVWVRMCVCWLVGVFKCVYVWVGGYLIRVRASGTGSSRGSTVDRTQQVGLRVGVWVCGCVRMCVLAGVCVCMCGWVGI